CALCRPPIDRAIPAAKGLAARSENAAEAYAVSSPDVLEVTIDSHPELSGQHEVGPDGRVDLGATGRLRVEGHTVADVAYLLALVAEGPPARVQVRVAEYRGRQLYLIGQVAGIQRVVAYQGPETVMDLLHRAGGITPGAAPDDVHILRSRLAEGKPPDVLRV